MLCVDMSQYAHVVNHVLLLQESPWDAAGGFDVDPFGQQNVQTPTDPFAGGDPFGTDPFAMKLSETSNDGGGGGTNPFGGRR